VTGGGAVTNVSREKKSVKPSKPKRVPGSKKKGRAVENTKGKTLKPQFEEPAEKKLKFLLEGAVGGKEGEGGRAESCPRMGGGFDYLLKPLISEKEKKKRPPGGKKKRREWGKGKTVVGKVAYNPPKFHDGEKGNCQRGKGTSVMGKGNPSN